MLRVLLPVDGSESSTRAVQMAVQMYQRLGKVEVLLLHVEVADGVPATALAQGDQRAAAPADPLAPAKALLDAAGVPHTSEMRRGSCTAAFFSARAIVVRSFCSPIGLAAGGAAAVCFAAATGFSEEVSALSPVHAAAPMRLAIESNRGILRIATSGRW